MADIKLFIIGLKVDEQKSTAVDMEVRSQALIESNRKGLLLG